MNKLDIVCWWSGGITSAVACYLAIILFGKDRCTIIMIDTFNEHDDTYRFKKDCEKWYGKEIKVISTQDYDNLKQYKNIQDTWYKYNSLNTANGAICSSILKRKVREEWQKENTFTHQIFGFEMESNEFKRAKNMTLNNPDVRPIYPLLMYGFSKKDCLNIVEKQGIKIPLMYFMGFSNNNCFKTGCVQGGIGYWQKIKRDFPEKFEEMARIEHDLTKLKGVPVTMLKDQSKEKKKIVDKTGLKWKQFVFLKDHPDYTELTKFSDLKGREPESLMECNGFCGINDGVNTKEENKNITDQLNLFDHD